MSQSIWTRCGGRRNCRIIERDAWRVVESQFLTSTRKLVDSDDEQFVLEELIDRVKPPMPEGGGFEGLHFLLFTPFRHPPLRNGSRFGRRNERGIWYGSIGARTAFAEVAYYRLVFLEGTAAKLGPVAAELSSFRAAVRAEHGIDLTAPPFDAHLDVLASKTAYEETQVLGAEMREDGIEAFLFRSARDVAAGTNVGLLEPVFAKKSPRGVRSWVCTFDRRKVEIRSKDMIRNERFRFPRGDFEVDGQLPAPAL